MDEQHPIHPVDVNGINKLSAEMYHTLYSEIYDLSACVLRLTNTIGPRMRIRDARQTFLGIWVRQLLEGRPIEVWGGEQLRDFNDVEDVVDALMLAALRHDLPSEPYNLGSSEVISLVDLARLMIEINGTGELRVMPFPPERKKIDIGDYYSAYDRYRAATGWQPRHALKDHPENSRILCWLPSSLHLNGREADFQEAAGWRPSRFHGFRLHLAVAPMNIPSDMTDPFNFPQQDLLRYHEVLLDAVDRITVSGQVILGEGVRRFEAEFATWLGSGCLPEQVIGVANGTDAVELALRAAGVVPGDRVLLPAHTAYATAAAVLRLEAVPVFVDLEEGRAVLSPAHLRHRLRAAADHGRGGPFRAVIAVHLYGEACDLEALQTICADHGLALIEDCAQSCGTTYRDQAVGTRGDFAAFSFYPTKNLAAFGDGGALVVNRPEAVEPARRSRFYGWDQERQAVQFGVNSRLDELQAWVLLGKLQDLSEQIAKRRQVAAWYRELLAGVDLELPEDGADWRHSYHLHVVRLRDPSRRAEVLREAQRQGVPLALHYALACHQQPYIRQRFGPQDPLPETERRLAEILTLPLHPHLERAHVEAVVRVLRSLLP